LLLAVKAKGLRGNVDVASVVQVISAALGSDRRGKLSIYPGDASALLSFLKSAIPQRTF
jgi:hypothetical protein